MLVMLCQLKGDVMQRSSVLEMCCSCLDLAISTLASAVCRAFLKTHGAFYDQVDCRKLDDDLWIMSIFAAVVKVGKVCSKSLLKIRQETISPKSYVIF